MALSLGDLRFVLRGWTWSRYYLRSCAHLTKLRLSPSSPIDAVAGLFRHCTPQNIYDVLLSATRGVGLDQVFTVAADSRLPPAPCRTIDLYATDTLSNISDSWDITLDELITKRRWPRCARLSPESPTHHNTDRKGATLFTLLSIDDFAFLTCCAWPRRSAISRVPT